MGGLEYVYCTGLLFVCTATGPSVLASRIVICGMCATLIAVSCVVDRRCGCMSMYVYLRVTISSSYIFDAVFRKIWLALTQYEAHGQTAPRANTCARSSCRARAPGHIANDSAERRT